MWGRLLGSVLVVVVTGPAGWAGQVHSWTASGGTAAGEASRLSGSKMFLPLRSPAFGYPGTCGQGGRCSR